MVGQDHITKTLQNAIKTGRISHAYLFTGPRGVGKTSVARILAHEVNKLAYKDDSVHLDIIEIDAASNRRIDEIRDLREKVRVAPTSAKYKVYIIDEVHMLTREAFNALLKTLEEPPAHCIFILATTEAHKLPDTIVSRTQRFEFKPLGNKQAAERLGQTAKHEKIRIDLKALELLAEFGAGSFRDSMSYLDQLSSLGKAIGENDVREMLGLPPAAEIAALITSVSSGDSAAVLEALSSLKEQGVGPAAAAAAIAKQLREAIVQGRADAGSIILLRSLIEIPASAQPFDSLEIALLEAAAANRPEQTEKTSQQAATAPAKVAQPEISSENIQADSTPQTVVSDFKLEMWNSVVASAKSRAASIYTALRLAKPSYEDGILTLAFQFPLHQKKLQQAKNKDLVAKLIVDICGSTVPIECVVDKTVTAEPAQKPSPAVRAAPLGAISNVFGAAEVVEA